MLPLLLKRPVTFAYSFDVISIVKFVVMKSGLIYDYIMKVTVEG